MKYPDRQYRSQSDLPLFSQPFIAGDSRSPFNEAPIHDAALKSLGEGLYTIDINGLVTSMNQAAEQLVGFGPSPNCAARRCTT